MSVAVRLIEMFEADRTATDWFARFPRYEFDHELGAKPWWPPLAEVWLAQGVRPDWDDNDCWPQAWALLRRLHDDYSRSKQRGLNHE